MIHGLTLKAKSSERNPFYAGKIILEFIEYALVFTIIAECNTLFHNSENYIPTSAEVVLNLLGIILAACLVLFYGLRTGKACIKDLKSNRFIWGTVLTCIVVFFAANVVRIGGTHAVRKYIFSFILFFPLSYILFRLYRLSDKPNELFYKHSDVICFIAILNLMVYLCVTLNPYVVQVQLTQTHWGGLGQLKTWNNYLNVCAFDTEEKRSIFAFTIFRNYGFTTEPLMYSISLVTALYTEIFLRPQQQRKVWKMILLFAAIFTTQSTLALLIAVGTLGLKLLLACKGTGRKWFILLIATAVLGIAYYLIRQKTGGSSFASHLDHYRAGMEAFFHHPLLGNGYVNDSAVIAFVKESVLAKDQGLSNSVAVVLAEGGILLGGMCMAPFGVLFSQIRKHNSMKDVAFWAVGPFGLYCVTSVHFHLLLMLFMAFGYAMLEIRTPAKDSCRIALADDTEAEETIKTETTSNGRARFVQAAIVALIIISQTLMLFSSKVWKFIFSFLKSNQLLFGQSTWKAYCFSLILLLLVVVINDWIGTIEKKNRPSSTKEIVFFVLYTILFFCLYPSIYSWVSTAFGNLRFLGDIIETFVIALLYFGVVFAGWFISYFLSYDKKSAVMGIACLVFCSLLLFGLMVKRISSIELDADGIFDCLAKAERSEDGRLFANEFPVAWKSRIPEIEYCGARYGAFAVMEDASVISAHNNVLSELLDSGFQVTELSDEYILYSNDKTLIASLSKNGYSFYMYYPFELNIEDESAKKLAAGRYTLTADLRLLSDDLSEDEPVCQVTVTYNDGAHVVFCQDIFADRFDENRNCSVAIPFSSGDWDRVDYLLLSENEKEVQLRSMVLKQTPSEIVCREYDGRHLAIRESYYDIEGNPCPKEGIYYSTSRVYNRIGRIVEERYYGKDGEPIMISRGYASVKREYSKKNQLVRESYYSVDGQPCMLPQGYAYCNLEYDNAGNVCYYRYYDLSDHLTMTTSDYAVVYKEYNSHRKVIYEAYFGTEEEPVARSNGVASIRIEYNADGTESSRTYYDLNGIVMHLDS